MTILSLILSVALALFFGAPQRAVKGATTTERPSLTTAVAEARVLLPEPETVPPTTATAAAIWDPSTQSFVYGRNIDAVHSIASITKLMTVLLVLERGVDLQQNMTIERADNDPEGARLPMPVGAVVTAQDLLFATLVGSDNNTTEALVRATGMSEAEFVQAMNARAADLGMTATRFTDVTGLGTPNKSTIRDLVVLANAAFQQPLVREATTTATYNVRNQKDNAALAVTNTNHLLGRNLRVLAGKTGYTDVAGGCLISLIRGIGEHELLFLLLGSANQNTRFDETHALADWAFARTRWQ